MSDRGLLFLFGLFMIVVSLASCAGLMITGQAATVDGLFLLLTCGLVALAFALYLWYMIARAMEAAAPPPPPKPAAAAKPAAAPAQQQQKASPPPVAAE